MKPILHWESAASYIIVTRVSQYARIFIPLQSLSWMELFGLFFYEGSN
jgi:hypothetical protein